MNNRDTFYRLNEQDLEVNLDYKEKQIILEKKFFKIFDDNKVPNYFDRNIWFLKNDEKFNNIIDNEDHNDKTLWTENKIYKLIKYLNTNDTIKNFKVKTENFISSLVKLILEIQRKIDYSNEIITNFNIYEKLNQINSKIKSIESMKNKINYFEEKTTISKVIFYLNKLEFLPDGEYAFSLNYKEMNSFGQICPFSKKMKKKIKLNVGFQSVNLLQLNLQFKNISFQAIELSQLNTKELNLEVKENEAKMDFIDKDLFSKKTKDISDENSSHFSFNARSSSTNYNPNDYSGSNLVYYGLRVDRNGEEFGSSNELFLDTLIMCLDDLLDTSKHSFISTIKTKIKLNENVDFNIREYDVVIGIRIDISLEVRISILKRIQEIFLSNITMKDYNENIIKSILDYNFPEISKEVNSIILPNLNNQEKVCCNSCEKCILF